MSPEWKTSLSATERYETIQKIQSDLGLSMSDAVSLEQNAYAVSITRDDYSTRCRAPPSTLIPQHDAKSEAREDDDEAPDTGIHIGTYRNCVPVSDGITSEVYRSGSTALKVIVNFHRDIEPHNPQRESRILDLLRDKPSIIQLLDVFRDQEQRLVLAFPFMPLTLGDLFSTHHPSKPQIKHIFHDVLRGLQYIHSQGIIHRDIKPSAVLLSSPSGPAFLSDFGTAWHPDLSAAAEPPSAKVLDIGTGPYRAPEVLFADRAYGPPVDMWGVGVMLSEAISGAPIFESRPSHEDGNQLGLILSIFKTLGTPTPETWPEAKDFKITPFEMWNVFPARSWEGDILPDVDPGFRELVAGMVRYDGKRTTAEEALKYVEKLELQPE
ncbi:unnamed protein product [Clonostachys byssicola]|uniref:Protein kinase domain-containing protein n=1 Tax=Clonostachys byssicola TaxID=160290 RepID=A0A9N9XWQ5_9HYPO|nr:unnamed protein product [Clonostachys byssicola]